ncbi:MAG: hypothetical protein M3070_02355 [Actinomycetota bacterium]|nr:hypothetical protein [Actinomycetota bacterium]
MPWVWLAALDTDESVVTGTLAAATWHGGRLVAWPRGPRPHPAAMRADAAFIDPAGPATDLTVQVLEPGREPLYDDPAVQHLFRNLERWSEVGAGALTSLTRDSSHWAGALFAGPVELAGLVTVGAVRRGRLEAGFASTRRQVLHGTQRNAGAPWPAAD